MAGALAATASVALEGRPSDLWPSGCVGIRRKKLCWHGRFIRADRDQRGHRSYCGTGWISAAAGDSRGESGLTGLFLGQCVLASCALL